MTEWDFFFFGCTTQYSVCLLPQPRIKLMLPALETWSLNHWTTWEVPWVGFLDCLSCNLFVEQRVNHWTNIFINRVTVSGSHYALCQISPISFQAYHGKSVSYRWPWNLLGTTKCGQKWCINLGRRLLSQEAFTSQITALVRAFSNPYWICNIHKEKLYIGLSHYTRGCLLLQHKLSPILTQVDFNLVNFCSPNLFWLFSFLHISLASLKLRESSFSLYLISREEWVGFFRVFQ